MQDLECLICREVPREPMRYDCCSKLVCFQCITIWDQHHRNESMAKNARPNLVCIHCRSPKPVYHKAFPEWDMVKDVDRKRVCGSMVSDTHMSEHEKSCITCVNEFKRIVWDQIKTLRRELVVAKAQIVVHERKRKRKMEDESRFERENVELRKQLRVIHERDRRANRRLLKKI